MDFHITGSRRARPTSRRTAFCDGAADGTFRPGQDVELSHWVPNRTPRELKADTSTGICINFLRAGEPCDLAVNNHVDADGVLAVFALVHPQLALEHADMLVGAASMGDFGAWAEEPAQVLYQALTLLLDDGDPEELYLRCFERVRAVLAGETPPEVAPGVAALARAVARIESGEIRRTPLDERFVRYEVPALEAPPAFNAPLGEDLARARARFDPERAHLVSAPGPGGWFHDLWYPGYSWAEVVSAWTPPGVHAGGHTDAFRHPPLEDAVRALQARERASGRWVVTERLSAFATIPGRGLPIVASFLASGAPAASSLAPGEVAPILAAAIRPSSAPGDRAPLLVEERGAPRFPGVSPEVP